MQRNPGNILVKLDRESDYGLRLRLISRNEEAISVRQAIAKRVWDYIMECIEN